MIVPLPTWIHLSIAVTILLVALYVPDAIGVATFPTLLLPTTLLRLALNVASTRLLQTNAGEVIKAFGTRKLRRRRGRVPRADDHPVHRPRQGVGARRRGGRPLRPRFDAGKQMAIDAELRGGSIDGHEARRRRRLLQRESHVLRGDGREHEICKGGLLFVRRRQNDGRGRHIPGLQCFRAARERLGCGMELDARAGRALTSGVTSVSVGALPRRRYTRPRDLRAAFDAAHEFAERLRALFGARVGWVRLYGSQARGDAHEESDVDVLAVVRDLSWKEKIAAIELGCDVSLARTLHISPVVMATADFDRLVELESSFARNVLAEGVAA
jgi:predicted nucleotidyltransferase